jgi:hypothetical protein
MIGAWKKHQRNSHKNKRFTYTCNISNMFFRIRGIFPKDLKLKRRHGKQIEPFIMIIIMIIMLIIIIKLICTIQLIPSRAFAEPM